MMSETVTPAFSEISAQDTALAAQEAQEWIEVSAEKNRTKLELQVLF